MTVYMQDSQYRGQALEQKLMDHPAYRYIILVPSDGEREATRHHACIFWVWIFQQAGSQHSLLTSIECDVSIFLYKTSQYHGHFTTYSDMVNHVTSQ
jgi:hypothetical protein